MLIGIPITYSNAILISLRYILISLLLVSFEQPTTTFPDFSETIS